MSYVNAPQTQLVATNCAACGRSLVDAVSVEVGMGPDCRKRLLVDVEVPEDTRNKANQIVYEIAVIQKGNKVGPLTDALRALGFCQLAERIDKRVNSKPSVIIEYENGFFCAKTPYVEASVRDWRKIPGRIFKRRKDGTWNLIPRASKKHLWNLLKKHYLGHLCHGPKGRFIIDGKEV